MLIMKKQMNIREENKSGIKGMRVTLEHVLTALAYYYYHILQIAN